MKTRLTLADCMKWVWAGSPSFVGSVPWGGMLDYKQEITVDDLEAIWDEVVDFSQSEHPRHVGEAGKTAYSRAK